MKQLPDYMQGPERPRSLDELRCRLNRRLSDFRGGWRRCDNGLCRRWKQCCGEGQRATDHPAHDHALHTPSILEGAPMTSRLAFTILGIVRN